MVSNFQWDKGMKNEGFIEEARIGCVVQDPRVEWDLGFHIFSTKPC